MRARGAPLVVIGFTTEKPCTGERPPTLRVRPWFDVRGVTYKTQPGFTWYATKRNGTGCLSGGGETHELAARARRAALVLTGLRSMEVHCTCGRPLSFGARPWCDVRAVASNAQPAFAWHVNRRRCAGCLSGSGETRELTARAQCHAGCTRSPRYKVTRYWRKAFLFRRRSVLQSTSCGLQRTPCIPMACEQAPLRLLSLGRWRNTQGRRARAQCRAGCDRVHY